MIRLTNISCLWLFVCSAYAGLFDNVPVETLDFDAYSGRWYQMYTSAIPLAVSKEDLVCVTADYSPVPKDPHKLTNTLGGNVDTPSGERINHDMGVLVHNANDPSGHLAMYLDWMDEPIDYLVIAVGPIMDGEYDWAVVSDINGLVLFILARNPLTFSEEYQQEVLDWVATNGFDTVFNQPIATYQGVDCVYDAVVPEPLVVTNLRL